jgi:hypothetical protein
MKLSDEMLKAYYDGELDLVARAEIEAAIERDPGLGRIAENHRTARAPAPAQLAAKLAPSVQPLQSVARPSTSATPARQRKLPFWGLPVAGLVLGLVVGKFVLNGNEAPYAESESGLVARGELAWALTGQLASDTGTRAVRIGASFRDRSGAYCRTFRLQHEASFAGLACRRGENWQLQVLTAAAPGTIGSREITAMPMAVLRAVDAAIDGEPLDAAAEAAARDSGWLPQVQPVPSK